MPNFLDRAVALFREPDVGLVQTPQNFVNPDPVQVNLGAERLLPDEQRFFFDVVLPARDAWGTAFCCGTSAVIRLAPLLAIGGFPTNSVTEDYLLSLRLKERGFRTVLSARAAELWPGAGRGRRIRVAARPLVPRHDADHSRTKRSAVAVDQARLDRSHGADRQFPRMGGDLPACASPASSCRRYACSSTFSRCTRRSATSSPTSAPTTCGRCCSVLWISNGRTQPILTEVWQLLAAPEIVRAVYAGLMRPKGGKFVVTDKGGDRSKGFIHGDKLAIYFGLMALTFFAIGWNFFVEGRSRPGAFGGLAFGWSWFNIVLLSVLGAIAVEQPRRRRAERYDARGEVRARFANGDEICKLVDISLGGLRLASSAKPLLDEAVSVDFGRGAIAGARRQDRAGRLRGRDRAESGGSHRHDQGILFRRLLPAIPRRAPPPSRRRAGEAAARMTLGAAASTPPGRLDTSSRKTAAWRPPLRSRRFRLVT